MEAHKMADFLHVVGTIESDDDIDNFEEEEYEEANKKRAKTVRLFLFT